MNSVVERDPATSAEMLKIAAQLGPIDRAILESAAAELTRLRASPSLAEEGETLPWAKWSEEQRRIVLKFVAVPLVSLEEILSDLEKGFADLAMGCLRDLIKDAPSSRSVIPDSATPGWQDISTAPLDSTEVIVRMGLKDIRLGWYFARGWLDQNGKSIRPTHWMPKPADQESTQ